MKSNFCVLMDLLGISPKSLSITIGADLTLISKWRTGSRILINGRHWVSDIAEYMITKDNQDKSGIIKTILSVFYPTHDTDSTEALLELLKRWLTTKNQYSESYQNNRLILLSEAFSVKNEKATIKKKNKSIDIKFATTGIDQIKDALLQLLEQASEFEPAQIRAVCVEGLSIIACDEKFLNTVMDLLTKLFDKGYKLTLILRTDFKISEVALISGYWLKLHLLGYVESYYYDDFTKSQDLNMLIVYPDKVAIEITPDDKDSYKCEIEFKKNMIEKFDRNLEDYKNISVKRFIYNYFKQPNSFLDIGNYCVSNSCYLFSNLPHLTIRVKEIISDLGITEKEAAYLFKEFNPLMTDIKILLKNVQVYSIFCIESIEDALEHSRKLVHEYSEILGRRIYMPTNTFVKQLIALKELSQNPNFNICFLDRHQFEKIGINILISGLNSAVSWIPGLNSAACKDFTSVGALSGFCSTVYKFIPDNLKTKSSANKKLTNWIRRAKLFGYDV